MMTRSSFVSDAEQSGQQPSLATSSARGSIRAGDSQVGHLVRSSMVTWRPVAMQNGDTSRQKGHVSWKCHASIFLPSYLVRIEFFRTERTRSRLGRWIFFVCSSTISHELFYGATIFLINSLPLFLINTNTSFCSYLYSGLMSKAA